MSPEEGLKERRMRGASWMMEPDKASITVLLSPDVHAVIEKYAREEGISVSEEIAEICSRIAEAAKRKRG